MWVETVWFAEQSTLLRVRRPGVSPGIRRPLVAGLAKSGALPALGVFPAQSFEVLFPERGSPSGSLGNGLHLADFLISILLQVTVLSNLGRKFEL